MNVWLSLAIMAAGFILNVIVVVIALLVHSTSTGKWAGRIETTLESIDKNLSKFSDKLDDHAKIFMHRNDIIRMKEDRDNQINTLKKDVDKDLADLWVVVNSIRGRSGRGTDNNSNGGSN